MLLEEEIRERGCHSRAAIGGASGSANASTQVMFSPDEVPQLALGDPANFEGQGRPLLNQGHSVHGNLFYRFFEVRKKVCVISLDQPWLKWDVKSSSGCWRFHHSAARPWVGKQR
jgi:hypothetical protein